MLVFGGFILVWVVLNENDYVVELFDSDVAANAYIGKRLVEDNVQLNYRVYNLRHLEEKEIYVVPSGLGLGEYEKTQQE